MVHVSFDLLVRETVKSIVSRENLSTNVLADQVFGDEEMHGAVRQHCMDYIVRMIFTKTIHPLIF